MARTRAAASTKGTGRAANGAGSVVARTLASGSTPRQVTDSAPMKTVPVSGRSRA